MISSLSAPLSALRRWLARSAPPTATLASEPLEPRRLLSSTTSTPAEPASSTPEAELHASLSTSSLTAADLDLAPLAETLTGPIELDGFAPDADGDGWIVTGSVALPGGGRMPFNTDAAITAAKGDGGVTLLDVELGPVDLDLLGLRLDLQRVALRVIATPGEGQVLGNLISDLFTTDQSGAMNALVRPLNEALGAAVGGGNMAIDSLGLDQQLGDADAAIDLALSDLPASSLLATPAFDGGTLQSLTSGQTPLPDEVRVLSLSIGELDLNVLGLRVQTLAPVDLSLRAASGPGKLLGNLFVGLASLLDPLLPQDVGGPVTPGEPSTPPPPSSMDMLEENAVPVIGLELRDVDLYLLGLEASLNVDLAVALQTEEGDFLGKLLLNELEQIEAEVREAGFEPLESLLGYLFNGTGATGAVTNELAASPADDAGVTAAGAPATFFTRPGLGGNGGDRALVDPEPITLIDLSIDGLDLDLLGVLIRSQGISLELRADPGPGALLGNLVGRLVGGFGPGVGSTPANAFSDTAIEPANEPISEPMSEPNMLEQAPTVSVVPVGPIANADVRSTIGGPSPIVLGSLFAGDADGDDTLFA